MPNIHYNGNISYFADNNFTGHNKEQAKDYGNKEKKYFLRYKHYRQIASAAGYMYEHRKNKVVFFTFTIQDNITDNRISNPAFSYAIQRLKQNYGLHSYIWVAEKQKRGAIHYHCLFDIPYTDYDTLKRIWSEVGEKYGIKISRKNSVSGSKGRSAVVNSMEKAVKYLTKYIAKGINGKNEQTFPGRVYAISRNINVKPLQISHETALKYASTQTRAPLVGEHTEVLFCDVQAVSEDWEQIKQESKAYEKAQTKRKIKRCLHTDTRRNNTYYDEFKKKHYMLYNIFLEKRQLELLTNRKDFSTLPLSLFITNKNSSYENNILDTSDYMDLEHYREYDFRSD